MSDDPFKTTHLEVYSAYKRAVDRGKLLDSEVRRFWIIGRACEGCNICSALSDVSKGGIGVYDYFVGAELKLLIPPAHDGCDCDVRYVADLTQVTETPFD